MFESVFPWKDFRSVYPPVARVRNYYHKQLLIKLDTKSSRLHFKKVLQKTKKSFESIASFKSTKLLLMLILVSIIFLKK